MKLTELQKKLEDCKEKQNQTLYPHQYLRENKII